MLKSKTIEHSKKPPIVKIRVVYCSPTIHLMPKWKRDLQAILNQIKREGNHEQSKRI